MHSQQNIKNCTGCCGWWLPCAYHKGIWWWRYSCTHP